MVGQVPATIVIVESHVTALQASVADGRVKLGTAGHSIVDRATWPIVGFCVSLTWMVSTSLLELPQASVTVHVMIWFTGQVPVTTIEESHVIALHASEALGRVKLGVAGHSSV